MTPDPNFRQAVQGFLDALPPCPTRTVADSNPKLNVPPCILYCGPCHQICKPGFAAHRLDTSDRVVLQTEDEERPGSIRIATADGSSISPNVAFKTPEGRVVRLSPTTIRHLYPVS